MKAIVNKVTGEIATFVRDDLPEGFAPPEGYDLVELTPEQAKTRTRENQPRSRTALTLEDRIAELERRLGLSL